MLLLQKQPEEELTFRENRITRIKSPEHRHSSWGSALRLKKEEREGVVDEYPTPNLLPLPDFYPGIDNSSVIYSSSSYPYPISQIITPAPLLGVKYRMRRTHPDCPR